MKITGQEDSTHFSSVQKIQRDSVEKRANLFKPREQVPRPSTMPSYVPVKIIGHGAFGKFEFAHFESS